MKFNFLRIVELNRFSYNSFLDFGSEKKEHKFANGFLLGLVLIALTFFVSEAVALDEEIKAQAREVLKKNADAIVSMKCVCTQIYSFGTDDGMGQSQKNECNMEVPGMIVASEGLSLFAVDPRMMLMDDEGDKEFNMGGGEKFHIKPKISLSNVKLVLGNGNEIPAELVLKDTELGLGFVRPKEKPPQPLAYISFGKPREPEMFDDIISLHRLSRAIDRTTCVAKITERAIQAVVKKPRTFFVGGAELGKPFFNSKGEALGVGIILRNPVQERGTSEERAYVILPSEEVQELVKQALAAKPG